MTRLSTATFDRRIDDGWCSIATIMLLLFVGIMALVVLREWNAAVSLMLLWLFLFILVGNGPAARWLTMSLQRDVGHPRDISFGRRSGIVLLGDGTTQSPASGEEVPTWLAHSRIGSAARLYRAAQEQQVSCKLIVVGGAEAYANVLAGLGVARTDIEIDRHGSNTFQHAQRIAEISRPTPFDSLFLVTSALHLRRAGLYFNHFGLHPVPIPADFVTAQMSWFPIMSNFAIAEIACHQYIGIARLHVYNVLGWNKRSSISGS